MNPESDKPFSWLFRKLFESVWKLYVLIFPELGFQEGVPDASDSDTADDTGPEVDVSSS